MTAHAWITSAAMVAGFILVMVLLGRLSRDLVAMEIDRVRREHRILDAVEYGLEESRLLAMLDQVRPTAASNQPRRSRRQRRQRKPTAQSETAKVNGHQAQQNGNVVPFEDLQMLKAIDEKIRGHRDS